MERIAPQNDTRVAELMIYPCRRFYECCQVSEKELIQSFSCHVGGWYRIYTMSVIHFQIPSNTAAVSTNDSMAVLWLEKVWKEGLTVQLSKLMRDAKNCGSGAIELNTCLLPWRTLHFNYYWFAVHVRIAIASCTVQRDWLSASGCQLTTRAGDGEKVSS